MASDAASAGTSPERTPSSRRFNSMGVMNTG
jgi:hypothetical protein